MNTGKGTQTPNMERKVKVLVCDNSAFFRVTLRRIIESDPGLCVVDIARNGQEAVEKAIRLKPDVITMDIDMPVIDGVTALKDIVRLKIAPVIMLNGAAGEDTQATMEAIEAGAFDFIQKPTDSDSFEIHSAIIIRKIKQAVGSNIYRKIERTQPPTPRSSIETRFERAHY